MEKLEAYILTAIFTPFRRLFVAIRQIAGGYNCRISSRRHLGFAFWHSFILLDINFMAPCYVSIEHLMHFFRLSADSRLQTEWCFLDSVTAERFFR